MDSSEEERAHWRDVLRAFDGYMQYHLAANQARRNTFNRLPEDEKEVYDQLGFREKLDAVDEGIRRNAEFIDEMIADPVFQGMMLDPEPHHPSHSHDHAPGAHHNEIDHAHDDAPDPHSFALGHSHDRQDSIHRSNELAQDKVRSTLRSFVRDWAAEGAAEREACYLPCLEALERHFPAVSLPQTGRHDRDEDGKSRAERRVLVPGCGLGRLLMEIVARGFSAQGNEFSTYMLLGSNWVLNQTSHASSHQIHPYLHSFSNHTTTSNLLRRILIPDVVPSELLDTSSAGDKVPDFSLVAGDFEEIYGPKNWSQAEHEDKYGPGQSPHSDDGRPRPELEDHRGQWDAVVTCFFLDCAADILSYLRIIHALLTPGGIWSNVGPLLWHYENTPGSGASERGSIELSLDEVKALVQLVGFDIHDEKTIKTTYTGVPDSMLRNEYNAAFWTATKRTSP